ncbi:hypothetical protein J6590_085750 [Homalodisca vitripennis]|nr:hypothetical protein J6590_085750 [Homalodisca vitripennis]
MPPDNTRTVEFSCEPCKKVELDYLALEPEIDEISEQIIINLGEDSDTEDDNDDSHPESDDEMDDVDLMVACEHVGAARRGQAGGSVLPSLSPLYALLHFPSRAGHGSC